MAGGAHSEQSPCCPQHTALLALMSLCLFLFVFDALCTSFCLPESACWMLHVQMIELIPKDPPVGLMRAAGSDVGCASPLLPTSPLS